MDEMHVRYLEGHRLGRLSTVGTDGNPQNKPVGYRYNKALGTVDIAGLHMARSAKYRNVAINPNVAFVVDDSVGEGAGGKRFLEIRGPAERIASAAAQSIDGLPPPIIRIHPQRLVSWNIDPANPGMQTRDLIGDADPVEAEPDRPGLDVGGADAKAARDAVDRLVEDLQAGWDSHDAQRTDRLLGADVVWGSPFGATVLGYPDLHDIHRRLKAAGTGGPASRFEVVAVITPAPGVAVAQVRRVALDAEGVPIEPTGDLTGAFSETALYVLVRRGETWWVAAGQNTPIRIKPAS